MRLVLLYWACRLDYKLVRRYHEFHRLRDVENVPTRELE